MSLLFDLFGLNTVTSQKWWWDGVREPMWVTETRPVARAPHKCPVCEGRGTVPSELYGPLGRSTVKCRTCKGATILWEPA